MKRIFRSIGPAAFVFLLGACAPECHPGDECPGQAASRSQATPDSPAKLSRTDANTYFAMFMNDPTNKESWRWLCRAAAGGHSAAQYSVAVRYRDGLPPVRRNPERAYRWFTAAQQNGLTAAALAREDLAKHMTDSQIGKMRTPAQPVTEADCREAG